MPLKLSRISRKSPPRSASQTRTQRYGIFPAPSKGLNASSPLVAQDPLTANLLNNFWVRKYGSELRGGYERWTTNLGGIGTEAEVLTLMAYNRNDIADGRLFAACSDGNIYDVTSQSNEAAVPVAVVSIPGQVIPGQFSFINFSTAANTYLCICSEGGGFWTYDSIGGWVDRTASITGTGGPYASQFNFVFAWKNRLWFARGSTTEAYYLAVDSIAGDADLFDFGPLFIHGGDLRAMASWTVDGGDGIDDKMIVMGGHGDLLMYQGTDPSDPTKFGMGGRWYVGQVPNGNRFMSKYGGDVSLITEFGVEYMSHLLNATGLQDPETPRDFPAARFNEIIGQDVKNTRSVTYWQWMSLPGEVAYVLLTPHNTPNRSKQYIFSEVNTAWSTFTNMPMVCAEVFNGELYFGTLDGKVAQAFNVDTDDELSDGTVGASVQGDIQTAFVTDPADPMALKRMLLIMPMFQSRSPPQFKAQVNTEWSSAAVAGSPPYAGAEGDVWDVGLWDTAIWGGADNTYFNWIGAEGLGVYASLRMAVVGVRGTLFTSWKLVYEPGGIM